MASLKLDTLPLTYLKGVGPALAKKFKQLGISSLEDLLFHLPLRYEDRTKITPIRQARMGQLVQLEGEIGSSSIQFGRRRSLQCVLVDKTGTLTDGKPRLISRTAAKGFDQNDVLARAAALERLSEHPLGASITAAAAKESLPRFTAERVFDIEYASDPQIAPDGRSIVYVRRSMDKLKDQDRGDLWTIDVDSGAHRPLITGGASAGAPRWSPDGTKLLYSTTTDGKPDLRIYYFDSDRSVSLAQFQYGPGSAAWSPDFNTNVSIGMVRMTHCDPGTPLEVETTDGMRRAMVQETFWL